ncbi:CXXC-type zinc finger protein 1-like [Panonychus citri]|uniref:CXXC-type zinc finger protein 1-like n=1 Tax=Panonychus citri TaxID=50023 RepID=UPI002307B0D5|nr:CXXC-type zinc finger protein 1-like [Panonychus citri]
MNKPKAYCICRSSDSTRFMIGCDSCNEWYHGDCISITEELAKTITKFYCLMCRDANPALVIEYNKDKSTSKQGTVRRKKQQSSNRSNKVARLEDGFGRSENRVKFADEDEDDEEEFDNDDDDRDETFKIENELTEKSSHKKSKSRSRPNRKTTNTRSSMVNKSSRSNKTHRTRERESYENDDNSIRQCYGPGCVNIARRSSKYCSDECGLRLAHNRMVEILPQRITDWRSTGSTADVFSNRELENIKKETEAAKKFLEELDVKQKELDSMIAEAKKLPAISEDEADDSESGDAELMIYCVTCGHEIASRTAMRHMERCFNKFESQISYFGATKTKVDGVFCNVYSSQQKTYCMRLKVLCPEHTKEQRIPDTEICGFPLVINCFEPTGTYCRLPKKKCMRHYCWEKLRQAQLDMEKVQKWFKLEELLEKEAKIGFTMSSRSAILGLLLHKTDIQD